MSDYSPDISLISETWCNDDISMAMLNIDSYYKDPELRKDREDTFNGIGGGLLVYVRIGLLVKPINNTDNHFNQFLQFEVLSNDDIDTSNNLVITLVYRPPSSNEANMSELLQIIKIVRQKLIIHRGFKFSLD